MSMLTHVLAGLTARNRTARVLAQLDDHIRRDIGLPPADPMHAVRVRQRVAALWRVSF